MDDGGCSRAPCSAHERHNKQAVVVVLGGVPLRTDVLQQVVVLFTEGGFDEVPMADGSSRGPREGAIEDDEEPDEGWEVIHRDAVAAARWRAQGPHTDGYGYEYRVRGDLVLRRACR